MLAYIYSQNYPNISAIIYLYGCFLGISLPFLSSLLYRVKVSCTANSFFTFITTCNPKLLAPLGPEVCTRKRVSAGLKQKVLEQRKIFVSLCYMIKFDLHIYSPKEPKVLFKDISVFL